MSNSIQAQLALAGQHMRAAAYGEAEKTLRNVLDASPSNLSAWLLLGQVCGMQQNHTGAEQAFAQAVRLDSSSLDATAYLGIACMQQDKYDQAIIAFKSALEIQPNLVMALANMVVMLHRLERQHEALPYQERWLEIEPLNCKAHYSAGVLYQSLLMLVEARKHYSTVLSLGGDGVSSYSTQLNLGVVCHQLSEFDAAIAYAEKALIGKPDCAACYCNIGNAQKEQGKHAEAIASFERALKLDPNFSGAHGNILFCMNYCATYSAQQIYERHCEWAVQHTIRYDEHSPHSNTRDALRTLRIGYVSADFREHPVGFFLEGVLQNHSRKCDIYCYANSAQEDVVTERLQGHVSHWRKISALDDDAVAAMIREDGIDILVDLSGHTEANRLSLFAKKPAPVQVSWLGYFATTGLPEMDYLIADPVGVPDSHRAYFSEAVWYLPETRLCFSPPNTELPVTSLPALKNDFITFGSFQHISKVSDEVLAVWAGILGEFPNAKLRWQCAQLKDSSVVKKLKLRLQENGINTARVALLGGVSREAYLAAHSEVDMILDTFPYPGGTTTCEALWMGVPTLTLAGETLLSRQGASLLSAVKLEDWVAFDAQGYAQKALALASDIPKLAKLRGALREQASTSPLFDAPRFVHNLEDAYRGMWLKWCSSQE